ncbi:proline-rich protein 2-like [Hippopotamus amphibius kiboko]|uniref:proline-rich protein 2-like n=1 Tax=Hippopotamus amphibius kiboko TaxID=575201 RepID=UPI002596318F|nr:proline-rich protein 2-like [Hippopotamus amphibius kiboko]
MQPGGRAFRAQGTVCAKAQRRDRAWGAQQTPCFSKPRPGPLGPAHSPGLPNNPINLALQGPPPSPPTAPEPRPQRVPGPPRGGTASGPAPGRVPGPAPRSSCSLRPDPLGASAHPRLPPRPPGPAQRTQAAHPAPFALQARPLTPQVPPRARQLQASPARGCDVVRRPAGRPPKPPAPHSPGRPGHPAERTAAACRRPNAPAPAPPSSRDQRVARASRPLPGDFWEGSGSGSAPLSR